MNTTGRVEISRVRLGLYLLIAGMVGVVVLTTMLIPQLTANTALPAPLWIVVLASTLQSAMLVALAVWSGVVLAPKVGFRAPAFEAAVIGESIVSALKPQLRVGLVVGAMAGVALFMTGHYVSPAALAEAESPFTLPILARVLYGGITEELLLRWGLMTLLVWLAWRFLQRRRGAPQTHYVWLAIVLSALLFGAAHLPAAALQVGQLTTPVVVYIIGANAGFGCLFGYLYWRHGLEAAMIAHATAHVASYVLSLGAA